MSVMHSFAQVPNINVPRSQFNLGATVKSTFNFDYLVPIYWDHVVPGDTFNVSLSAFARLATQKVPIMDNMYMDYFFFYVPNRLVYDNWEKLMGARTNPSDSISYILPQMTFPAGGPEVSTIFDYYGLPTDVTNAYTIKNTLPLRCYPLIWNEWFRDQNMQNSITVPTDDGPDVPADFTLLKRGRRHDYFTSALPWPQKGTAVTIPLGTTAPVIRTVGSTSSFLGYNAATGATLTSGTMQINAGGAVNNGAVPMGLDPQGSLSANLTGATAATLNQLRESFAIQSLLERDARGGTRFVELTRAHYGVTIPDYRVQRPEYLGGGSTKINSHPVPNTTSAGTPASLAAYATSSTAGQYIGFNKSFVEHGYVIGLACARGEVTYQQGLRRFWNYSTRYDHFFPEFIGLGEQSILNKEIYCTGAAADELVFGYNERYAELKYKPGEIHGIFRSTYATPLDQWHLGEEFGSLPALNSSFIEQHTPIERAVAVTTEPHILFDGLVSNTAARPLPVHSTPVSLGRF